MSAYLVITVFLWPCTIKAWCMSQVNINSMSKLCKLNYFRTHSSGKSDLPELCVLKCHCIHCHKIILLWFVANFLRFSYHFVLCVWNCENGTRVSHQGSFTQAAIWLAESLPTRVNHTRWNPIGWGFLNKGKSPIYFPVWELLANHIAGYQGCDRMSTFYTHYKGQEKCWTSGVVWPTTRSLFQNEVSTTPLRE